MSDGVAITIPSDRTEGNGCETFHVSADQAADIAADIIDGMAFEYINGTEDLHDDHDTRRGMRKQALAEVKDELYGPYGRM